MGPPRVTGCWGKVAVTHSDGVNGVRSGRPQASRRTATEYFAAIDVSLELSSVCVVDETGPSEPTTPASSSLGLVWKRVRYRSGYMPSSPAPSVLF
jgi:hypothetical protein